MRLPIEITDALEVRLGAVAIALTPSQGFAVAEDMIRKSARRVISEEAANRAPTARPRANSRRRDAR